jgi:hypothetical protein
MGEVLATRTLDGSLNSFRSHLRRTCPDQTFLHAASTFTGSTLRLLLLLRGKSCPQTIMMSDAATENIYEADRRLAAGMSSQSGFQPFCAARLQSEVDNLAGPSDLPASSSYMVGIAIVEKIFLTQGRANPRT